jgi:hypothetical protein
MALKDDWLMLEVFLANLARLEMLIVALTYNIILWVRWATKMQKTCC